MSDDAFAEYQKKFERSINQGRAELAAVRAILQALLVSISANNPRGEAMLEVLRTTALSQFERPWPDEASHPGRTMMRELSLSEVEVFFAQFDLSGGADSRGV